MRQLRDAVEDVLDDGLNQGAGNTAGMGRLDNKIVGSTYAPGIL